VSVPRCVLCGATAGLFFVQGYAGVKGADAWTCSSPLVCAERQIANERVAREDRAAEVGLRGEERVAELEKEANR